MKKTPFMTKLAIFGLMCTVFPSNASADHRLGSYFQAVVLSQEQSPNLDVSVGRYSMNKGRVNVSSATTRKPIDRVKIFSMTASGEIFFLGVTDRKGNLNFENGYKHVMQLSPRGGYRKTEKYHSATDIDLVIAMIGDESSVVSYKKGKNLQPTY
jgi:hypothetical protein